MKSYKKNSCCFLLICVFSLFSCRKVVEVEDISGQKMVKINTSAEKDKHLILDLRDNAEYKNGHLDFALNIPLKELKTRVGEIEDLNNIPIYIYANNADESFVASQTLCEHGFWSIFNAEGVDEYSYDLVKYNVIRVNEVRLRKANSSICIIDYRTPSAYQAEHFKDAINISVGEIPNNLHLLPKDKNAPIIMYCNTGITSAWGAKELMELGYNDVSVVLEGAVTETFKK